MWRLYCRNSIKKGDISEDSEPGELGTRGTGVIGGVDRSQGDEGVPRDTETG